MKRSVSSRGEPSNSVTLQKPTMDDALVFLRKVRDTMYEDRKEEYDAFLNVLVNFRARRIGVPSVIARVKDLLKGQEDLIKGFNIFLPKACEIALPMKDQQPPKKKRVEFFDALEFVGKVRARFEGNDGVYRSFLELLEMYSNEAKTKTEVYDEVVGLFKGHPDLLEGFTTFLL